MIKAAVLGYGNVGKAAIEAVNAAPDFELAGVISRKLQKGSLGEIPVVRSVDELEDVQVVLLCVPSRKVPDIAEEILLKGISTVDCYDIHTEVYNLYTRLNAAAKRPAADVQQPWDSTRELIRPFGHYLRQQLQKG